MRTAKFEIVRLVLAVALCGLSILPTTIFPLATVAAFEVPTELPGEPLPGAEDPALTHGRVPRLSGLKQPNPKHPSIAISEHGFSPRTDAGLISISTPRHVLLCVWRE